METHPSLLPATLEESVAFLRQLITVEDRDVASLEPLSRLVRVKQFEKGTRLTSAGRISDEIYCLREGIAQILVGRTHPSFGPSTRDEPNVSVSRIAAGRRRPRSGGLESETDAVTYLTGGEIFGDRGLKVDGPETRSVCALTNVEVLSLRREDVQSSLFECPRLVFRLVQVLNERLERSLSVGHNTEVRPQTARVYPIVALEAKAGRTSLGLSLATVLAQITNSRVLFIDPNLTNTGVSRALGITSEADYVDRLVQGQPIDVGRITWKTKGGFTTVLPPCRKGRNLREAPLTAALHTLISHFDYVIVDSSSVLASVNRAVLREADRIVFLSHSPMGSMQNDRQQFESSVLVPNQISADKLILVHGGRPHTGGNGLHTDLVVPSEELSQDESSRPRPHEEPTRRDRVRGIELPWDEALHSRSNDEHSIPYLVDPDSPYGRAVIELAHRLVFDCLVRITVQPRSPRWETESEVVIERLKQFLSTGFGKSTVAIDRPVDAPNAQLVAKAWTRQKTLFEGMESLVGFLGSLRVELGAPYLTLEINGRMSVL